MLHKIRIAMTSLCASIGLLSLTIMPLGAMTITHFGATRLAPPTPFTNAQTLAGFQKAALDAKRAMSMHPALVRYGTYNGTNFAIVPLKNGYTLSIQSSNGVYMQVDSVYFSSHGANGGGNVHTYEDGTVWRENSHVAPYPCLVPGNTCPTPPPIKPCFGAGCAPRFGGTLFDPAPGDCSTNNPPSCDASGSDVTAYAHNTSVYTPGVFASDTGQITGAYFADGNPTMYAPVSQQYMTPPCTIKQLALNGAQNTYESAWGFVVIAYGAGIAADVASLGAALSLTAVNVLATQNLIGAGQALEAARADLRNENC